MIKENKVSKYLLYALGEIILVIIGILFALQINNWNENRKTQIDLESSFYAMIDELKENANFLEGEKKNMQYRVDGLNRIFDKTATDKDLRNILDYFGPNTNSKPFNSIFNSLKEEKLLQLIDNKELVKKINNFYEYDLPNLAEFCKWHEGFVGDNIDPYILENIPIMDKTQLDVIIINRLLKEVKFQNILRYQNLLYKGYISSCDFTTQKAEKLIVLIENYLKEQEQ